MTSGFVKVFAGLWQGTLYGRTREQLVFLFLLAHADGTGEVDCAQQFIAGATGLDLGEVAAALEFLEAPDPESRTPDEDGRRIVRLDPRRSWGWRVVNHGRYRAARDPDSRREQTRSAMRGWRERRDGSLEPEGIPSPVSRGEPGRAEVSRGEPKQKQKQKQKQNSSSLRSEEAPSPSVEGGETLEPRIQENGNSTDSTGKASGFERLPLGGAPAGLGVGSDRVVVPRASLEFGILPTTTGQAWTPTVILVESWRRAYPAVDLPAEFARMRAWLESHPREGKTPRGMSAFVNTWLGREQDRGGRGAARRTERSGVRTGADARYLEANGRKS